MPLGLAVVIANLVVEAVLYILHQREGFLLQFVQLVLKCAGLCLNAARQFRCVHLGIHRHVQGQVLVGVVVVIDDACIGIYHAIHGLHVAVEYEGGESVVVPVIDAGHLEVALQGTLACRSAQPDAQHHTD